MPEKADILLSENLDTWLLGEHMIPTVKDARQRLLKPDAKVIPQGATIYVQVIESSWGFGKYGFTMIV